MPELKSSLQFKTKHLFFLSACCAIVFAFLSKESLSVAIAASFSSLSTIVLAVAAAFSLKNLVHTFSHAWAHRDPRLFSPRIKWIFVDGLWLVWFFVAVSSANFVFQNDVHGARWLVFGSFLVSPVVAVLAFNQFGKRQE